MLSNWFYVQSATHVDAQTDSRVVVVMLDGLRWKELFGGADPDLMANASFVSNKDELKALFAADSPEERRSKLMPFMWGVAKDKGFLLGNRDKGSLMNVANHMHFSYPGYSETLCGYPDDARVNSNDKTYNPNRSILEIANATEAYRNSVLAFASWDVFPYILNEKRSGIEVNAGYRHSLSPAPTAYEKMLDDIQDESPRHWEGVRFDVYTFHYALEAMKTRKPKLIFVGFGETDDFAHEGRYDMYLKSVHRDDDFIRRLWEYAQSDPFYKGKTTFLITTDHGRGDNPHRPDAWKDHGSHVTHAGETWFVALGAGVEARGEVSNSSQNYNKQVAAIVASCLGIPFQPSGQEAGTLIPLCGRTLQASVAP